MLIQQELTELLHQEIAVIMSDGNAYRGTLKKFDGEIIILSEIYETSTHEIDWVETEGKREKPVTIKGFVPWRKITLPRLIIRMNEVLRIWPWIPGTPKGQAKKKKKKKKVEE